MAQVNLIKNLLKDYLLKQGFSHVEWSKYFQGKNNGGCDIYGEDDYGRKIIVEIKGARSLVTAIYQGVGQLLWYNMSSGGDAELLLVITGNFNRDYVCKKFVSFLWKYGVGLIIVATDTLKFEVVLERRRVFKFLREGDRVKLVPNKKCRLKDAWKVNGVYGGKFGEILKVDTDMALVRVSGVPEELREAWFHPAELQAL